MVDLAPREIYRKITAIHLPSGAQMRRGPHWRIFSAHPAQGTASISLLQRFCFCANSRFRPAMPPVMLSMSSAIWKKPLWCGNVMPTLGLWSTLTVGGKILILPPLRGWRLRSRQRASGEGWLTSGRGVPTLFRNDGGGRPEVAWLDI